MFGRMHVGIQRHLRPQAANALVDEAKTRSTIESDAKVFASFHLSRKFNGLTSKWKKDRIIGKVLYIYLYIYLFNYI